MKQETIQTTVFYADDGKKFLDKEECQKYERHMNQLRKIQFFLVMHTPDLNETGGFTSATYVAINPDGTDLTDEDILNQWAIDKFGFIGCGVMGWRFLKRYSFRKVNKVEFDSGIYDSFYKKKADTKVFLSLTPVDGLPEPTNVFTSWANRFNARIQ